MELGRARHDTRRGSRACGVTARLAGVGLLLGSAIVITPAALPVFADPASGPGVFTSGGTGAIAAGNVPDGTCRARIVARGGAGGSSASTGAAGAGGFGAAGAQIDATFAVLPQQSYSGSVGGGGAVALSGGANGGGNGGNAVTDHDGAGGGGRTVATIAGTNLVVAGGGGGAGAAHQASPAGNGGAAGFSLTAPGVSVGATGSNGVDAPRTVGGGVGGQTAAGGAGGVNSGQAARNGTAGGGTASGTGGNGGPDNDYDAGGGGGAGYTGGGGGASTVNQSVSGAGGGGGSSFVAATSPVVAAPAPTGVAGSAGAAPAANSAGADGSLRMDWQPCLYDLTVTKSADVATVNAGGRIRWTVAVTNNGPDPMTRGDILTLADTLPSGSNASSPSPNNVVVSVATAGGSNANLARGAVTCTGVTVGAAMPTSTNCTRPYASLPSTPGSPTGGTRGLDPGETLTIVYDQIISNTAACGTTITNQATVNDRPTQTGTTDVVGVTSPTTAAGNNSSATVAVNCYDLAITKTASPTPAVAQGGTVTWTISVTNNGPADMVGPSATTANPLVITDTFPTTGVGTPTLVTSVGPAGACTRAGATITCPGSLNSGQTQTLTFNQTVNVGATLGSTISNTATVTDPGTTDTNDSSTGSTIVSTRPRLVLRKTLSGQNRFSNSDQFVMSLTGTGGGTATTGGTGSTITGGTVTVATATAGSTYTLSESMAAGSVATLGQYSSSISCSNALATSTTPLPAGAGTSFSVVPQPGDDITCTFANTPAPARVRVAKVTLGGTGSFGFAATNLTAVPPGGVSVTTTATGTPATSSAFTATAFTTPVLLTETVPAGWRLTGATCVDANASVTGNTGTFGTLTGNQLTVPQAVIEPAADITCTFTNEKLARLVVQKTANGGAGTFGFTTGGLTPASFDLSPTIAVPTQSRVFADLVPGTYTVTEGASAPFQLTDLTCVAAGTSAPGSTVTTNVATRQVSATLVAGADFTCTYTNVRDAQVTVTKTAIGGDATFAFTTAGTGNAVAPAPSITTAAGVGSSSFGVVFASGVTSRTVTITESAPPAGWVLTGISCTDGNGASVGAVSLPSVTITATPGQTFNCNVTNQRLPRITVVKQSIGGTAPFSFTSGSNGLPASFSLDTRVSNPQSSAQYQVTALGTATVVTETVPTDYTLTSATCVTAGGAPVSTSLAGGTLTIDGTAIVGGGDLTCTFVNTRRSAQVRVDKRWLGAVAGNAVSITSSGGTNNPSLNAVANTSNEVDAGTAVTVYSGETLTFAEAFTTGSAANYTTGLACTGASDATPGDGLTIAPADTGATIVCTYTNSRLPNVVKSGVGVTGPDAQGQFVATYSVVVDNPGAATAYGALTDAPAFAPNLEVLGATWTASSTSGPAPAGGTSAGTGPFTLAPAGTAIAASATHTYTVAVTFRFLTYTSAAACGGAGTGLFNSAGTATTETTTADNTTCLPPPAPPVAAIDVQKAASPASVSAPGQTVSYSFVVTNTGNVTLTSVVVTDPLAGLSPVTCPVSTLAPGASTTCTASYLTTQADVDAGSIANTATATGSAPNGSTATDTDAETVTAVRAPSIQVVKSAVPATVTTAGQTVAYSFVVTNTGNVTLTSVGVSDPLPGLTAVVCPVSSLAPGASTTCTASYAVTQADVNAGSISNTATASGTPPAGAAVTDTDTALVTATRSPSIQVVKSSVPATVSAAGQTVAYSFVVTNTGNVTLTSVGVSDPLPGLTAVTCPVSSLAPGASTTCTASYLTTQTDIDAGGVVNTATATGTPPVGPPVTDTDVHTVVAAGTATISLVKSAVPGTVTAAGQTVAYSFVVTNTGTVTLSAVGVSDPLPGLTAVTCPASSLAPGASTTCTASYTVTQADVNAGSISNTATATGTPPVGAPVTDTDTALVTATQSPSISLVKSALPTTVTAAGQTVAYSFVVANTGNVTLTAVGVADPLPGLTAVTCPVSSLAPGASTTCTASYTVTQADVNAGSISNTALATGTPPVGAAVTDTDTALVTATQSPSISIVKSATPATVSVAGASVAYSFVVTNTGNVTLTAVGVADPLPGLTAVVCPVSTLAPGASTTCTASYTVTQADIDAGSIANTATATGTPPAGPPVTDTGAHTVPVVQGPSIALVKTPSPATVSAAGDTVAYSFVVTNTGNITLTSVAVSDPLPGLTAVTCPVTSLAPGASTTCTASYTVTQADVDAGSIVNTATATGTPPTGPAVIDLDTATVTAPPTASIGIVKSAVPGTVATAGATIAYSFLVSNTGNVTLSSVGVSDPLPGLTAVTCPVTVLAPGASTTCTASYTVTQADVDAGSIANTATATGTPPGGAAAVTDTDTALVTATPSPSISIVKSASPTTVSVAGTSVAYSFVVTNTGNVTLTSVGVSDPLPGLTAVTCPVSSLAPGASTTCTASYAVTQADIDAGSITNTATATGTPPAGGPVTDTDTAVVTASQSSSIELVKSAVPNNVTTAGASVAYSFVVTNTGNVTLTSVGVSDPLPGLTAVTCPVSSLAPGASTTCTAGYTVTQADVNAGSIVNTATATGTPPVGAPVTDTDVATVTASQSPSIQVVKSALPATVSVAGASVAYSFVVTNTGNVTLSSVGVSDPLPGLTAVVCPVSSLAPGASTTCTATYPVTQADIDAGSISNTATASGTPPVGAPVNDSDTALVTVTQSPSISIVKSANPTTVTAAGASVAYSFVVSNTGNVTLSSVGVSDPLPGLTAVTCPVSSLAPGASTTCTASYAVTQADVNAGSISNTATASGTPPVGAPVNDSDTAVVTATQAPSISIVKSATPTTVTAAGASVAYSFVVTNTGNVTLTSVGVSDPLPGISAVACPVATLAPSSSTTCTATYTVTQADVDGGAIANTATASGTPPVGAAVTDSDSALVSVTRSPSIALVKSASPSNVTAAGQTIAYSFAVTNTGNVTLDPVVVTDPLAGLSPISCPVTVLAPGGATTCTATYLTTVADIDAGGVTNLATATGTPPSGAGTPVSDTDGETVTAAVAPSIQVVKTAAPTTVSVAGASVAYSFVVRNTGNVTLTSVGVSDPLPGLTAVTCPVSSLAPGASTTCTATYTVTQADVNAGSISNTATASGTPPVGAAVTDSDTALVTVTQSPSISIVKSATPATVTAAGQTVAYSFVVRNTGNVTLTSVGVADPLPGLSAVVCPVSTLAPSASTTCTASYTVTQADVNAGSISNTATASGTPPVGAPVTDSDTAVVTATQSPSISIVKSATPTTVSAAGASVAYSFVVRNTGNVTLTSVGVSDPLPGLTAVVCPVTSLAPGASTTCTASYAVTQADVNAGSISNTATASGTPPVGAPVTDSDTAVVTATQSPSISLVKTATPSPVAGAGEVVTYSFAVTNTGNVTLTSVGVTDPLPGLSAVVCPVSTLAPSASTTCTASYTVTQADVNAGSISNTATASGTPPVGAAVTDTDTALVTVTPNPSISIVKSATPTTVSVAGASVAYSFVVTNTGNVTLTSVGVTDPLPGLTAVVCPVSTLAPSASTTCTASYTVTQADVNAGSISNTATVSGTPPVGAAVTDTDTALVTATQSPSISIVKSATPTTVSAAGTSVAYSFVVRNTGNVTLTSVGVTDPLPGLTAVTCPAVTLAPAASTTCTASYTVVQSDVDAGSIVNTATATGTPPAGGPVSDSDVATVTVAQSPSISIVKSATPTTVSTAGASVGYSFVVTNTGNVTLTSVGVADSLLGLSAVTCPATTLAPAASMTCTASYTVTQADVNAGSISNTALATGTPPVGAAVTDTDTALVTVTQSPSISVVKSATPTTVSVAGEPVGYSFVVTNTGNVTLTSVGVTDLLPGLTAVTCLATTLAPAASITCTAGYTVTQADVDAGSIVNTATASGTPPVGPAVTAVDVATVTVAQSPSISIVKSATPTTVSAAGASVAYSFVVRNTGNVTLTSVGVTDPLPGLTAVTCPVSSLAPGASTTCTATYTVTQADVNAGSISNTATASGTPPVGAAVTDTDTALVTATQSPSISVVKSATPTTVTAAGQTVAYSFVVRNTGNVTLTSVGVTDPLPGLTAVVCPVSTLAPSASTTCTASYTVTQADVNAGSISNTATVSGTSPVGAAVTDTDTALVTATQSPSISIAKSANPTTVSAAGTSVAYSFVVRNTGNVTLTSVGVTDPLPGLTAVVCPVSTLAPNASTTCTATYTVVQSDVDAGSIVNTATASGTPPAGPAVTAVDVATVTVGQNPSIDLVKTPVPATVTAAGDTVTYSFLVTNSGNVTLTGISVTDPLAGLTAITCPVTSLLPGASTTCTADYVVLQSDVDAGRIDNVATVTGTPPIGAAVSDVATATVTAVRTPSIGLVKSADVADVAAPGDTVTYSFAVTNTGNVTLSALTVSDPLPGLSSISCPVSSLAPGASTTCTATYSATQADIDSGGIDNTATAAGSPPGGAPAVTATDTLTIPAVQAPSLTLAKTATPTTVSAPGQTVSYSFVVRNTGNVTLTSVGVTDPLAGLTAVTCPITVLPPGTSTTCTASYLVTQADLDAGSISNTATASGTPPVGPPVTAVDSAIVAATRAPAITLDKSATPNNVVAAGQTVTYSFVVRNTGNVTLTGVTVTDPLPGLSAITCPVSSLAPAATTTCTATYVSTLADLDAGSIVNTATVVAVPPVGTPVSDTGVAVVTVTTAPAIQIVKSAAPTSVSAPGQTVTYSFVVTNTGNVTLSGISVSDPLPGLGAITCPVSSLAPGASTTCTAGYVTTQADVDAGQVVNTATVGGTPPSGPRVADTDSTTVTATRTPAIQLAKTPAPSTVTAAGQTVTYSFLVTNSGNVTLTGVGITDPLPGLSGISCPVTTLAPSATTTCTATYAVSQTDIDLGSIVNTATASGTPPSGPAVTAVDGALVTATATPSISLVKSANPVSVAAAGQVVTYSFVVRNTGNVTLTGVGVTDPLPGLGAVTCPVSSLAPSASTTCTATYVTTLADMDGGSIVNSATATGTPPGGGAPVTATDGVTVTATASPSISITKSATPNNLTVAGQTVAYSFDVRNTGNVTLTGVAVSDPLPGLTAIVCPVTVLAPGASTTCAATYVATQADVDLGSIPNTAGVTANPPIGPAVTATDGELVTVTQGPAIQVVKSAVPAVVSAPGQTIAYSFEVTNTGNVTLTGVAVSDPLPGLTAVVCPVSTLAPGASTTCTAGYTTTQADIDAGAITNTATASGTPPAGADVSDADTAVVTATANPAVDLVKRATPATVAAAGDPITYEFDVTNTGNVTLSTITITDPRLAPGAVTCPVTTLAPGASTTCAATYSATQADVDAGTIVNTATVSARPPTGPPVVDVSSSTVTAVPDPSITLAKSVSPLNVLAAGDTVTYSFFVTNTGNVTLSGVGISDPLPGIGTITCPATALAPGASTTCTASYSVTQGDVDAGSVVNTATASGLPPSGPSVSAVDSATLTAIARPAITLRKSATPSAVGVAGQQISYSFVVRNSGNVTLTGITVTDPLPGLSPVSCPSSTLTPGATFTCTATYTVTQADVDAGSVLNTATAVGDPPTGAPVRSSAAAAVPINAAPAMTLVKTANPTSAERVGDAVTYTLVVTNTGNVTLDGVVVTDPLPGLSAVSCPGFGGSLAPAESTTCTATYAATQADVDAGTIDNTATATGTSPTGRTVTATDDVSVPVVPAPAISLVKTVNPTTVGRVGTVLTFTFVARNVGNVTLTDVRVTDLLPGLSAVSCPGFSGSLVSDQSVTCTATYTVTQADLERGSIRNTATASASSVLDDTEVTAVGTVGVSLIATPSISLVKTASASTVAPGAAITYTFVVTNTGNVALVGVAVTDGLAGLGTITCAGFDGSLDPGETVTCSAPYRVSATAATNTQVTNVATATGTSLTGVVVASTGIALVTVRGGTPGLPDLPGTGTDVGSMLTIAAGLMGAGSLLLALGRRRRPPVTPTGA